MQPPQRGSGIETLAELAKPQLEMDWRTLTVTRGYKGPFLLLWCMMHWVLSKQERANFVELAMDMTAVFKLLVVVREKEDVPAHAGPSSLHGRPADGQPVGKPASDSLGRGSRQKWATEKVLQRKK